VRFEVLTVVLVKMQAVWFVTICPLVNIYRRLEGVWGLYVLRIHKFVYTDIRLLRNVGEYLPVYTA